MTASACRPSAFGVLFEEFDRVADGQNGFGRVVGNFTTKFLFEGHDELDRIETVGAEVVDETGIIRDLVRLDAQVLHDDLLHPLGSITHCSNLFVQRDLSISKVPSKSASILGDGHGSSPMRSGYWRPAGLFGFPSPVAVRLPHFIYVDQRDGTPAASVP